MQELGGAGAGGSDLVPWQEPALGLQLLKESVVLPLLVGLDEEVDAWGRGAHRGLGHLGPGGCLGPEIWGGAGAGGG